MRPQNKFDRGVEARRHARNTAAKPGATRRIEDAREAEERRLAQEEIRAAAIADLNTNYDDSFDTDQQRYTGEFSTSFNMYLKYYGKEYVNTPIL